PDARAFLSPGQRGRLDPLPQGARAPAGAPPGGLVRARLAHRDAPRDPARRARRALAHARPSLRALVLRSREPRAAGARDAGPERRLRVPAHALAGGAVPGRGRAYGVPPPAGRGPGDRPARHAVAAPLSLRRLVRGLVSVPLPPRRARSGRRRVGDAGCGPALLGRPPRPRRA